MTQADWLRDPEPWAIATERHRHQEALYAYGEYSVFVLLWNLEDHRAGLVERCSTCYLARGAIGEVYQQPDRHRCPDCYGTTFEGGYKARIIRPTLWEPSDPDARPGPKGEQRRDTARLETTGDFYPRTGDYAFRGDGTRWQLDAPQSMVVRTGFEPDNVPDLIAAGRVDAQLEDQTSVAYLIPPSSATLQTALTQVYRRLPVDLSAYEDIRGPLFPPEVVPDAP